MTKKPEFVVLSRAGILADRETQRIEIAAYKKAHPKENVIFCDAGDEIICDACNAEILEIEPIFGLGGSSWALCEACMTRMRQTA